MPSLQYFRELGQTRAEKERVEVQIEELGFREVTLRGHMTVRIPRGIVKAIEDFLRTEQAARLGFDSKADVATAAIRNLLSEYGYYRIPQKKEQVQ